MPSTSKKQHNFMEAVAHNPSFAKKVGVKQSVGKDFSTADKGKTFKQGGDMASKMNPGFMAMMKKKAGDKPAKKMAMGGYADGGMPMVMKDGKKVPAFAAKKMASGGSASSRADGIASKGKTKGKMVTMNKGGKAC